MIDENNDSAVWDGTQGLVQIIFGEPASKANSRRITRQGRVIKSQKALNYADAFKRQCRRLAVLMTCDVRVTMHIFYASRRPDLDESLILDLLQDCVYVNDRQVKEKHIYWHLDRENPRTELLIEAIQKEAPGSETLRPGAKVAMQPTRRSPGGGPERGEL